MSKIALIGASALVLALGVASASAQPTTQQLQSAGQQPGVTTTYSPNSTLSEGRAAAIEGDGTAPIVLGQHHSRG